jgi:hypothetical protein
VEVRAVDDLDQAVLAAAGVATLGTEIERALTTAAEPADAPAIPVPADLPVESNAVGEKFYSTGEVAKLVGKSNQWCYWAMRNSVFTRLDGTVTEPIRLGKNGKRRFSIPVVREIARSCSTRAVAEAADPGFLPCVNLAQRCRRLITMAISAPSEAVLPPLAVPREVIRQSRRLSRHTIEQPAHEGCHPSIFGQLDSLGQVLRHLAMRVGGDSDDDAFPVLE